MPIPECAGPVRDPANRKLLMASSVRMPMKMIRNTEISVDVLRNSGTMAREVPAPALSDRAARRIRPERFVVRAPVVTRRSTRNPPGAENEPRCRERNRGGPPHQVRPDRVLAVAEEQRRSRSDGSQTYSE